MWCVITVLATQKTFYKLANQDTWTCLLAKFNRQVMQQRIIENMLFGIFWTRRKIFVGGLGSFVHVQQYYWVIYIYQQLCSSRKYPYSPHRRDWNFLGGRGFSQAQKIQRNVWSLIRISRGVGGLRINLFCGGGINIFWNYTL